MSDSADQEDGPFEQRVGAQLAAERVAQKLELSDIAGRLRIPVRHLEAIEAGDYGKLPALPYSAGFVKSYANMLGLDGVALSRSFRDDVGNERRGYFEPEAYEPVDPSRVPSRMLAMVALGVAILLGLGYLLLRFEGDSSDLARLAADTPEEINAAMPAMPPMGTPAVPVVVAPVVPTGPITVAALERDVWVKISDRGADNAVLFRGVIKLGDSFTVPDTAVDPVLRTLLPQYVKVSIGTTGLPPVGPADVLVPDYSLKRDALNAIAMATPQPAETAAAIDNGSDVATDTAGTEAKPADRPAARRSRPVINGPVEDPAGSRPATVQPISGETGATNP